MSIQHYQREREDQRGYEKGGTAIIKGVSPLVSIVITESGD